MIVRLTEEERLAVALFSASFYVVLLLTSGVELACLAALPKTPKYPRVTCLQP